MKTKVLPFSRESVSEAAEILRHGGIVGLPTETVYGLAANAYDPAAVCSVFAAKGRPQDNPLIVHISDIDMLPLIAEDIPDIAKRLARAFWAGPLTMVFKKKDTIPYETSGGLSTVAVRMPDSEAARAVIDRCGLPLAAPSANLSGSPSPTTAAHVLNDMDGKIPLIIDGGECRVGVESTVVCFKDGKIRILRPGGITLEMLSEFGETEVDPAVTERLRDGERALSPGMKYKHYSPKANVVIVDAHGERFRDYCETHKRGNTLGLCFGAAPSGMFLNVGATPEEQAHRLFSLLREADERGADTVYVEMPSKRGIGLAVYNRLLRAAGFEIVKV